MSEDDPEGDTVCCNTHACMHIFLVYTVFHACMACMHIIIPICLFCHQFCRPRCPQILMFTHVYLIQVTGFCSSVVKRNRNCRFNSGSCRRAASLRKWLRLGVIYHYKFFVRKFPCMFVQIYQASCQIIIYHYYIITECQWRNDKWLFVTKSLVRCRV
jgi:hypothetical protein